jgi:ribulose-5-phosphate 4-epimerase/fuculose-1-phosphate aldolase
LTIDEGYIKYDSDWTPGETPDSSATSLLDTWRRPLYEAGLIGHYEQFGIGFGNLSIRFGHGNEFIISGTQTGHLARTDDRHYALVTACDIATNQVSSTGPVRASSEALTHAAIYQLDDAINAVVHVHSPLLWNKLLDNAPTTARDVSYGTPEMALEFARLYKDSDFAAQGIAVMAGHDDGIVSVGQTLEEAATRILDVSRAMS